MLKRTLLPLALVFCAQHATQAQTASQVITDMVAYCQTTGPAGCNITTVDITVSVTDGSFCYAGTGYMSKSTASITMPTGQKINYNTIAGNFGGNQFNIPSSQLGCTMGLSFGMSTSTSSILGGLSASLPNGTKKSYTFTSGLTVTSISGGFMLTGSLGSGKTASIFLKKSCIGPGL